MLKESVHQIAQPLLLRTLASVHKQVNVPLDSVILQPTLASHLVYLMLICRSGIILMDVSALKT
jgi:hypothetical protein